MAVAVAVAAREKRGWRRFWKVRKRGSMGLL